MALSPLLLTPLDPLIVDVRIQLEDGSPVDDVRVEAFAAGAAAPVLAAEATTPIAPGRFRLALYRETSYQVRVRRAFRTLHAVDVNANETLVVITLPKR